MTTKRTQYTLRPGKYIEYDFPLKEANRLAQKEGNWQPFKRRGCRALLYPEPAQPDEITDGRLA